MRMLLIVVSLLAVCMATGCASVSRGPLQQVHVNSYDVKTSNVLPADCFLCNDEGVVYTKSGRSVVVGRDKDPITINCFNEALMGQSVVDGKINAGFWAVDFFVIDMCLFSCWIDGLSGSWAEYPSMIDVSLNSKDDAHYTRLEEISLELNKQINFYNKMLNWKGDPLGSSYIIDTKNKIENSQKGLSLINSELSLRKPK